jgi:hypothetical protein
MKSETLNAEAGIYFLEASTSHTNLSAKMLQINTDAVFTTLTIYNTTTNASYDALAVKSAGNPYGQNLTARTVSQGMLLAPPKDCYYTAVTMSSGTAIAVNTAYLLTQ